MLTKETDWRVAKAYVALADDPDEEALHTAKCKETGVSASGVGLESRALDKYLDDDEWEGQQRRLGKYVSTSSSIGHKNCR